MKKILIVVTSLLSILLVGCNKKPATPGDEDEDKPIVTEPGKDYEALFVGKWGMPGLHDEDRNPVTLPTPQKVSGLTSDVTLFGAKANDPSFDNYQAFKQAIEGAVEGDEIFVPNGIYYFSGAENRDGYYTHIHLKSGIVLRGESKEDTILVSLHTEYSNQNRETTILSALNSKNIVIKDLTLTSDTSDDALPDPNNSGLQSNIFSAPKYAISIDSPKTSADLDNQTHNIVVDNVVVEKFQRMGIRVARSREITISNSTFKKAVNLGGGGNGYGITIQGRGHGVDVTGTTMDTKHNHITNNHFEGPYLRHGIIVQYYAHHNLIENNLFTDNLLDAMDLHGEDEYGNEIRHNTFKNTRRGAGIGVGNSGATHDAAGPNNYIHHNTIEGGLRGIDVILGSPKTVIVHNIIKDLTEDKSFGIRLNNAPNTYIMHNEISNITGNNAYGIHASYYYDPFNPEVGIPSGLFIKSNTFSDVKHGVYVETDDGTLTYEDNTFKGVFTYEFKSDKDTFTIPEKSTLLDPVSGYTSAAIDSNFITTEARNYPQSQKNMKLKTSLIEPQFNRMVYMKFDTTEAPTSYDKVYLSFSAKAQEGKPTISIHSTTDWTDWKGYELTWDSALFREDDLAISKNEDEMKLSLFHSFTFPIAVYEFNTYYIDVTEAYKALGSTLFTLIFSNDLIEEIYMEVYNHEQTGSNQHPKLIFTGGA